MNRAALRKLCDEATPEPWASHHRASDKTAEDDECSGGLGLEIDGPPEPMLRGQFARAADAAFVAAARTELPKLLDTLEAVEAWRKEWRGSRADWDALKAILEGGER